MTTLTGQRKARAIWSHLTEPGDPTATIAEIGVEKALTDLEAGDLGGVDGRYVERWRTRLDGLHENVREGRFDHDYIIPGDDHWPRALEDLADMTPLGLWVRGQTEVLTMPALSIVGARAATSYGLETASTFARALCTTHVIISGGAYGVDAAAHRAVLEARGRTVAVAAGGIDRIYPAAHQDLVNAVVISGGALISEQPPGATPARHRFLSRNRIIAALGRATIVVEAAHRSGALATARRAAELGRDVCAVPGPVTSLASAGTNQLLRDYGICVTAPDDVLELLGSIEPDPIIAADETRYDRLPERDKRVWNALAPRTVHTPHTLAREAGLTAAETTTSLAFLRSIGMARAIAGRWIRVAT